MQIKLDNLPAEAIEVTINGRDYYIIRQGEFSLSVFEGENFTDVNAVSYVELPPGVQEEINDGIRAHTP